MFLGPIGVAASPRPPRRSCGPCSPAPTARCGPAAATRARSCKVAKDGKLSTFFDAPELEVHALAAGAERRAVRRARRPTARSTTSPRTARRRRSSIRTTSTSGRSRWTRPATSSPRPATRASSTRSRPTARARASTRPTPPTSSRSRSRQSGDCIAGTESPGRVFRIDAAGKAFVLLDSPFREIHALRLAADGTIYAAAVNGTPGRREPRDRSAVAEPARPPVPSVSTEITAITVDGQCGQRVVRPAAAAAAGTPRAAAARSTASAPTACGTSLWDSGEDAPYDLVIEPTGQPARRHRHRRQDLPRQRQSGARDAARPRHGAPGHRAPARAVRPHRRRHEQSRKAVRARRRPRRGAAPTSPTSAMPAPSRAGAPSAGAPRRTPARSHVFTRSGQHRHAGRDLERVVEGVHQRRRRTDREPERALPAVARRLHDDGRAGAGADVGDDRVPAAQPAARGRRRSPSIRPARSSSGRSRPASWRLPASRTTPPTDGRSTQSGSPGGAVRIRPRARPPHLSEGAADVRLEGGGRERRPAAVRRALPPRRGNDLEGAEARRCGIRSSCGTRRRCPTARTS